MYWAAYIEDSLTRNLINTFAREVVEPGWWVEADDDEVAKKMAKWLRQAAIVEGETKHDSLLLIKKLVKQQYIRGSALVEHVPSEEDEDSFNSIQLLNPQTITAFTRPSSNILWPPDPNLDPEEEDELNMLSDRRNGRRKASYGQVPVNDDGQFCAYAQFWEVGFDSPTALFTREEITKFPKDADVGDIYGNSPIESIIERLGAMRKKIKDRDKAIEQKAWPTWMIQFGNEDDPWHPDDIDEFAEEEEDGNFGPGTKHFVQGDISVNTVGGDGDVPDLQHPLKHDTDQIIDALPAPKTVTAHAEDIGKQLAIEKNNRFGKRVKEARREVEYRFRRILIAKAEQEGWSTEGLRLRIAHPEGEDPDEYEERGTTIRYVSNTGNGQVGAQRGEGNPEGQGPSSDAESNGGQSEAEMESSVDYPDKYSSLTEAVDSELEQAIAD